MWNVSAACPSWQPGICEIKSTGMKSLTCICKSVFEMSSVPPPNTQQVMMGGQEQSDKMPVVEVAVLNPTALSSEG